jgi:hypothetical protein
MTGKDKHMPLYSSSDIERYLSGELSDPEMHAMERAALDDPFLADALEGMIMHQNLPGQPSFRQDMASLEKRLDERVAGRKGRVIPLAMRYAAAVILLLGVGVITWYTFSNKTMKPAPLAANKVEVPATANSSKLDKDSAQVSVPAPNSADSANLALADHSQAKSNGRKTAGKNDSLRPFTKDLSMSYNVSPSHPGDKEIASAAPSAYLSDAGKQPAAPAANLKYNQLSKGLLNDNQRSILSDSLFPKDNSKPITMRGIASGQAVQRESDLEMDTLKKFKADQLVFSGKVLNQQNIPLPGATLSYKKGAYSFNTVTDANGYFTLRVPKMDTTAQLVAVNSVGYEPLYAKLSTDDRSGNTILLKPQSASLNEVVVVGYGSKRKELTRTDINAVPPALSQTAVPVEGWPAYTNYLDLNKNSTQIDTTIRGYESISFIVNIKGELSHFRVEQSLSPAHDSLAIRLVKEGPAWKLLQGKKEKARVVITW